MSLKRLFGRDCHCTQWRVHGLCECDTEDAPVFPYVWEKIAPHIEGLPLVAHNAKFDEGCLKAVFDVYKMDYPDDTVMKITWDRDQGKQKHVS